MFIKYIILEGFKSYKVSLYPCTKTNSVCHHKQANRIASQNTNIFLNKWEGCVRKSTGFGTENRARRLILHERWLGRP